MRLPSWIGSFTSKLRRRRIRLAIEQLEDRTVPSTVSLVKDIMPGDGASGVGQLVNVNGTLFFEADDGVHGSELWRSDGTAAGTVLVKDIHPTGGSAPTNLTNVNGTLYFVATDPVFGRELWKSDGTTAGTVRVRDINPSTAGSFPIGLTNVNGVLFFNALESGSLLELWKTDGTEAGTVLVKDIHPTGSSNPQKLTNVNGTLFFSADNGANGIELWKSDGTEIGTVMVKNISGTTGSAPDSLINVNGTLFFTANDGVNGVELWKSNGFGGGGTVLVKDINPLSASSSPAELTNVNGTLFFTADDGASGVELWKSDGTDEGTVMVKSISGLGGSNPTSLTNVKGTLFFAASGLFAGAELWKSDGTLLGTELVKDIHPTAGSAPTFLTNVNGTLYFSADDGSNGRELWKSDGTESGTFSFDIHSTPGVGTNPKDLTNVNGTLFFRASDSVNGEELWKLTEFSDDFDRDESSQLGNGWTEAGGDFALMDKQLVAFAAATSTAFYGSRVLSHVRVEAEVSVLTTGFSRVDLMARRMNPLNMYLGSLIANDGAYTVSINKMFNGVITSLASKSVTPSSDGSGVLRFEVAGGSLKLFFNDRLAVSINDASIGFAGLVGVRGTEFTTFENFFFSPIDPELPFGDSFERADATSLGNQWSENAGDLVIKNGRIIAKGTGANVAVQQWAPVADVVVQASVSVLPFGTSFAGLVARYAGPGDKNMYMGGLFGVNGSIFGRILRNVNGVWSTLAAGPSVGSGKMRFEVVGSSLKLFVNGALVARFTDSALANPGQIGVRGGSLAAFDAFNAETMFPTLFQDTFNNGNSIPNWSVSQGFFTVQSDKFVASATGTNIAVRHGIIPTISFARPLAIQADVALSGILKEASLIAGYQNMNNYYYASLETTIGSTSVNIYKVVNGVKTRLLTNTVGGSTGTLRFEISRGFFGGQTLAVSFNSARFSVSDSNLFLPGLVGIRGTLNATFDNFVMAQ